jgi:hypothetical protein
MTLNKRQTTFLRLVPQDIRNIEAIYKVRVNRRRQSRALLCVAALPRIIFERSQKTLSNIHRPLLLPAAPLDRMQGGDNISTQFDARLFGRLEARKDLFSDSMALMKTYTSRLALSLSILPVPTQSDKPIEASNIPTATFCELVHNPDIFNGEEIRIPCHLSVYFKGLRRSELYGVRTSERGWNLMVYQ